MFLSSVASRVCELCPSLSHAVAAELAALHELHSTVCSLLSQHIRDLAELQPDLELLPPHGCQRGLKLPQLILRVEADQPHPLIVISVISLQGKKRGVFSLLDCSQCTDYRGQPHFRGVDL